MKTLRYILLTATAILGFSACSEKALDEVNKDVNHAPDAEAKFVFADLTTSTAFTVVGGDFNTYLGVAVEHWGGVHNQLYSADQRDGEWISSTCFNNAWIGIYNTIKNARVVVAKTDDKADGVDAGNKALNGAAKVLLAYNSSVLTDLFGDTPYKEACDYFTYPTPKIDKQEDIYRDIYKLLDEAIEELESCVTDGKSLGVGSFDFIYNGNSSNWLKFAYGLRARLKMHTILRAEDKAAVYTQILSDIDKSFASAADQASFSQYDGGQQSNPLAMFWLSREAIAASKSLAEKLSGLNDPRLKMIFLDPWMDFIDASDPEAFFPVPNGEGEEVQETYTDDAYLYCLDAPTHLLSYAELQYLKAEVLARQGTDLAGARTALGNAIQATFANVNANIESALQWGDITGYYAAYGLGPITDTTLSDADIADYVTARTDDTNVPDADLLKEIMLQKYLYFHNANGGSVEAYNDVRRLKAEGGDAANYIVLANPKNDSKFPLRCGYGSSDTTTNPNVKAAFGDGTYVYKEPVWWALGSR